MHKERHVFMYVSYVNCVIYAISKAVAGVVTLHIHQSRGVRGRLDGGRKRRHCGKDLPPQGRASHSRRTVFSDANVIIALNRNQQPTAVAITIL